MLCEYFGNGFFIKIGEGDNRKRLLVFKIIQLFFIPYNIVPGLVFEADSL